MKKFLLGISLFSVILSGIHFSIETEQVRAESSSGVRQVTGFNALDYLVINPKKVKDFEGKSFELSDMVKDVVGTYSGMKQNDNYMENFNIYHLNIQDDGTYILLNQKFTRASLSLSTEKNYFDSSNQLQSISSVVEIDGDKYTYYDVEIARGILVEKFGKLHFVPLAHHSGLEYITSEGQVDVLKGVIASEMSIDYSSTSLPDSKERFQDLITRFDYQKDYLFKEGEQYILDGKVYFGDLELSRSNDVDPIVSEGLGALVTQEFVLDMFKDANGIFQLCVERYRIPSSVKLVPYTDYSKVYTSNGDKANVIAAFLNETSKELYVYRLGRIDVVREVNGTFVIQE